MLAILDSAGTVGANLPSTLDRTIHKPLLLNPGPTQPMNIRPFRRLSPTTATRALRRVALRSRWRRYRAPELPGLWPSPGRFYHSAQEEVSLHPDGWTVSTNPPGHRFISWELAVRYEAAYREARLHYSQICDMATGDEVTERLARIADLIAEAERLSRVEQAMHPVLATSAEAVRMLAHHPYGERREPQQSRLRPLASKHLDDILPTLDQVLVMRQQDEPFHPDVFRLLLEIDKAIPGPGTHTAVWDQGNGYLYPFDKDYERVLRPLRYVPAELWDGYASPLRSRYLIMTAGGYLEGCVKTALRDRGTRPGRIKAPLGTLIAKGIINDLVDADRTQGMRDFANIAVNPAKHDFVNDHGPGSLFSYEDALYAYFLARRFGASILVAAGCIPRIEEAVKQALAQGIYHRGAALSTGAEPPGQ